MACRSTSRATMATSKDIILSMVANRASSNTVKAGTATSTDKAKDKASTTRDTVQFDAILQSCWETRHTDFSPGQYQGYQQGQQFNQPQQSQPPKQPPTIAKRPTEPAAASSDPTAKVTVAKEGGTKVLSIGGDAPKPKAKVLTIGAAAAPPKEEPKEETAAEAKDESKADEGAKVTAAKALEKTGEKTGSEASGKTSPTPSSGRSSPSRAAAKGTPRDAAAVEQAQTADVDEDTLKEMYGKEHVNIIFIGHVDAGKSTLGGAILVQTGMVDQRTLDKYKREAKEAVCTLKPSGIVPMLIKFHRVVRRGTCHGSWILQTRRDPRARPSRSVEVSSRRRSESTVSWMHLATRLMCQT